MFILHLSQGSANIFHKGQMVDILKNLPQVLVSLSQLLNFISLGQKELWFSSVQSLSPVRLFAIPWTAAHQVSLSITNSRSLLKLKSIE